MKRKTAMIVAQSGGDLKMTSVQERGGEGKWGGFMTRGPEGEYSPILTLQPRFDTKKEADDMLLLIVRGAVQLGLDEGWLAEADPKLVDLAGEPERVFTPAPDQPAVEEAQPKKPKQKTKAKKTKKAPKKKGKSK